MGRKSAQYAIIQGEGKIRCQKMGIANVRRGIRRFNKISVKI